MFDHAGQPMTAASAAAVAAYEDFLDAYGRFSPTVPDALKATLAADPEMPLAWCARGALMMLSGKGELRPVAEASATKAQALAAQGNVREQAHAEALAAWVGHDETRARDLWDAILQDHPKDFFALKLSQFSHFYAGGGTPMRAVMDALAPKWTEDVPRYGKFLGIHAFALEENGAFEQAQALGRRAVSLDPEDPWAIHAVAHCLEMEGRTAEGLAWIDDHSPHWANAGTMTGHLAWHRALFALETEGPEAVLADFAARYQVGDSEEYLDLCNDIALLQRLALRGLAVKPAFAAVADRLGPRLGEHMLAFCDAHWVLGLAAAERFDDAEAVLTGLRDRGAQGDPDAAPYRTLAVPLGEACLAFHRGAYSACWRGIQTLLPILHRLGGSHAQRDLFVQLMLAAAAEDGAQSTFTTLLAERQRTGHFVPGAA